MKKKLKIGWIGSGFVGQVAHLINFAKKLIKKILCIPINEKLTANDLEYVSDSIKKFYGKKTQNKTSFFN